MGGAIKSFLKIEYSDSFINFLLNLFRRGREG